MAYDYSKPISVAILFAVIISATGRPSEKHVRKTDVENGETIQVVELNDNGSSDKSINSSVSNLDKLFYNVSQPEHNIPVQVIYDSLASSSRPADDDDSFANSKIRRNSRVFNITEDMEMETAKESDGQYYLADMDEDEYPTHQPVAADELKSLNRTKNPFAALILTGPEFLQPSNSSTSKKVPVLFHLFSPSTKNKHNDTVIERIDHKYLIPILEKLKRIMTKHSLGHHTHTDPVTPQSSVHFLHSFKKPMHKHPLPSVTPTYQGEAYFPSPYPPSPYPMPQFYPYWNPYQYYPLMAQEPFQAPYHNYIDQEYIPTRENCHGQFRMAKMDNKAGEEKQEEAEEVSTEGGIRRYDEDSVIEYVDHPRSKRHADRKKVSDKMTDSEIRRWHLTNDKNKEDPEKARGSEVGPQISKLIVRRGGVAIAGAGGIATAGSGGTAIVGPGGTAFTTPTSSGGVAMVGPGGKVVRAPDVTNVLYGRHTPNVAATGAGHTTITNKNGEVFTTSDHTGGVALVNPGGGIIGFSDNESIIDNAVTDPKEVQVPAGARFSWDRYRPSESQEALQHDLRYSTSFTKEPQSWRPSPITAIEALNQDVRLVPQNAEQSSSATERKLSDVIVFSNSEPEADVECKSESQPLFLRPQSQRRLGDERARRVVRMLRRKMVQCINSKRSNFASSLKTSNKKFPLEAGHTSQIVRRDDTPKFGPWISPYKSATLAPYFNYQAADAIFGQRYVVPSINSIPNTYNYSTFQNTISTFDPVHKRKVPFSHENVDPNWIPTEEKKKLEKPIRDLATHTPPSMKLNETEKILIELDDSNKTLFRNNVSPVVTKIILKPLATAKAGAKGVAISSPLSTAFVKRGDYVEIEYVPDANAEVGEGGVAISRPELIIHFIDKRR